MKKEPFTSSEAFMSALKQHGGYIKCGEIITSVILATNKGIAFYENYGGFGLVEQFAFYCEFPTSDWTFLDGTGIYQNL